MFVPVYSVLMLLLVLVADAHQKRAIVILAGEPGVSGQITLTERSDGLLLVGHVYGLAPGKHGFHVHTLGDISKGCISTGGHYNPHNVTHGAPEFEVRHAGDLGNIVADANGVAAVHIVDKQMALSGEYCILGRTMVVHSGIDNLGRGGHRDSNKSGNAGGRVACGIIGVLNVFLYQCVVAAGNSQAPRFILFDIGHG